MNSSYFVRHIIEHEFIERVGKFQVRQEVPRAMLVSFRTELLKGEEGYRYFDLLIYAPQNYVTVWSRTRWVVIAEDKLQYDEESGDSYVKKGHAYDEGFSQWEKLADHDSAWREGIASAFRPVEDSLTTFAPTEGRGWYSIVDARKILEEGVRIDKHGYLFRTG